MRRIMRILLLAALLAAMAAFAGANAEEIVYLYETVNDSEAWLTGCEGELTGEVTLPEQVDGLNVTGIGDNAFCGFDGLTKLTLPRSITRLGDGAFNDCDNLRVVVLGGDAWFCTSGAFSGALMRVERGTLTAGYAYDYNYAHSYIGEAVEDGWEYLIWDDGTAAVTLAPDGLTGDIVVPDALGGVPVTVIGPGAFYLCGADSVTVPESVTILHDYAFAGEDGPAHVWLPDNCTVDAQAFSDSTLIHVNVGTATHENIKYYYDLMYVLEGGIVENGFEYYVEDGYAYITGYDGDPAGELVIPGTLGSYDVYSIEPRAFSGCAGITSVTMPENRYVQIQRYAFSGCTGLVSVNGFTNGWADIGAFMDCTALESFVIPDDWSGVSDDMFNGCTSLVSVHMPENLEMLCDRVFAGCTSLSDINIPENLYCLGTECFKDCVSLTSFEFPAAPRNAYYGYNVFKGCTGLTEAVFEEGIVFDTIGEGFFDGCVNLETVSIPVSADYDSLGYRFFGGCAKLGEVFVPASVSYIDLSAFEGCDSVALKVVGGSVGHAFAEEQGMKYTIVDAADEAAGFRYIADGEEAYIIEYLGEGGEVVIPEQLGGLTVTGFAADVFGSGDGVTAVTVPGTVARIPDNAFKDMEELKSVTLCEGVAFIGADAFLSSGIESIVIPDSVTKLKPAFAACKSLKSAVIGDGVTEIGCGAFAGCTALETVTLGDSLSMIMLEAFYDCTALKTVENTGALEIIDSSAFYNCAALESFTLPYGVRSISYNSFDGCEKLVLKVISGTYAEQWCIDYDRSYENYQPEETIFKWGYTEGGVFIQDVVPGKSGVVTVPAEIEGQPVVEIGSSAFMHKQGVVSVELPDTLNAIGFSAFYNCADLEKIVIPDSVTRIGGSAFYGCESLRQINIPESVTYIEYNTFAGCTALEQLVLHADVEFYNGVFEPVTLLRVPADSLSMECARGYDYRHALIADASADGWEYILLDDGTAMLALCTSELSGEIGLPEAVDGHAVTRIGPGVLSLCPGVTKVTVPDSVTFVESYAFWGCEGLTDVYLPDVCSFGEWSCFDSRTVMWASYDSETYNTLKNRFGDRCNATGGQTEGNYEFIYDGSVGGLVISRYNGTDADVVLPETLGGEIVIGVGGNAFAGNAFIESVTAGESYSYFGTGAFRNCANLKSFSASGDSVAAKGYLFAGCEKLETAELAFESGEIPNYCFYGCESLQNVTGGDIRYVYDYAFAGCASLTEAEFCADVNVIGDGAFMGSGLKSVTLSKDLASVNTYAFADCTSLETVTFQEDSEIYNISEHAFEGCTALKTVNIPIDVSLYGIYADAFAGCASLTDILLPPSLNSLDYGAFDGCDHVTFRVVEGTVAYDFVRDWGRSYVLLDAQDETTGLKYAAEDGRAVITGYTGSESELVIPETLGGSTVTAVAFRAFKDNSVIRSVTLPDSLTGIDGEAFCGSAIESIVIPEGVTYIGEYAFYECAQLESAVLPASVGMMNNYVFYGCTSLRSVSLPEGLYQISDCAFMNCTSLETLRLPYSLDYFYSTAFENCPVVLEVIEGSHAEMYAQSYSVSYTHYLPEEPLFLYEVLDDGTLRIMGGVLGEETDLVIPAEIDGHTVVEIYSYAFEGNQRITGVTIADTVRDIYYRAFADCPNLKAAYLPGDVWFDGSAFTGDTVVWAPYGSAAAQNAYNCWQEYRCYPDFEEDGFGYVVDGEGNAHLVTAPEGLTGEIAIPDAVKDGAHPVISIEPYVFKDQTGLTGVTFGKNVAFIRLCAFRNCDGIAELELPAAVWVNSDSDYSMETLLKVVYDSNAYHSASSYGYRIRFVGDRTDKESGLRWYASGDVAVITDLCEFVSADVVIPEALEGHTVSVIADEAFEAMADRISTITIPDCVNTFGENTFAGCENVIFCVNSGSYAQQWLTEKGYTVDVISLYEYEMAGENAICLTGTDLTLTGVFTVPESVDGYAVTGIASGAFADQTGLTAVQLGADMTFEQDSFPAGVLLRAPYQSATAQTAESLGMIWQYTPDYTMNGLGYVSLDGGDEMLVQVSADITGEYGYITGGYDNLSAVGPYAFHGSSHVQYVGFDFTLTDLMPHAFEGDHGVKIVMASALERMDETSVPEGVIFRAYEGSSGLELAQSMGVETVMVGGDEADGFSFTVDENGGAVINDGAGRSIRLVIPETLDGHPVTGIEAGTFVHAGIVVFPATPIHIHDLAFVARSGMTAQVIEGSDAEQWCIDHGVSYEYYTPGEVTWLTEALDDGTCMLTGCIGAPEGEIELPSEINGIPVTVIGENAFSGYPGLTRVVIPEGVHTIEAYAFVDCANLKLVEIPESVTGVGGEYGDMAFDYETALRVHAGSAAAIYASDYGYDLIYFPEGAQDGFQFAYTDGGMFVVGYEGEATGALTVPEIIDGEVVYGVEAEAFRGQTGLTSVTLPDSVIRIDARAFEGCAALESIDVGEGLLYIGESAFRGCTALETIDLPGCCYEIRSYAFAESGLTGIELNGTDGDEFYLGGSVFEGCASLETAVLNANIQELSIRTFAECESLKSVVVKDYLFWVGGECFLNCRKLESIELEAEDISGSAFEGCESLTLRTWNNSGSFLAAQNAGVPCELLDSVDEATGLTYRTFRNSVSVTGVKPGFDSARLNVPAQLDGKAVTEIGQYAFSGLGCIEELTLPDTVGYIGRHALENLFIREIELPAGLDYISECMLAHCTELERIALPDGVTGVGNAAFRGCTGLSELVLPDSLEWIDYNAFEDCSALGRVYIPNSVTYIEDDSFDGCDNLLITAVTGSYGEEYAQENGIPFEPYGETTDDGTYAYEIKDDGTARLLSVPGTLSGDVTVPSELGGCTVTEIGPNAFIFNSEITSLTVPGTVKVIGSGAFNWMSSLTSLTLSEGVEEIGSHALANCSSLTAVNLPASLTEIGDFMFLACDDLREITLPEGVKSIGHFAFSECSSLLSVALPSTLERIGSGAFESCCDMKQLEIPASVTGVGEGVFYGCGELDVTCHAGADVARELQAGSGIDGMYSGVQVYYYASESVPGFGLCRITGCGEQELTLGRYEGDASVLDIPAVVDGMSLKYIAEETFRGNETLESVTIAEGVEEIHAYAFAECTKLKTVSLPDSLLDVRTGLFMNCTALESITLPIGNQDGGYASSINVSAFEGCTALKEVVIPDDADYAEIGDRAFANCTSLEKVTMGEDVFFGSLGYETFLNCAKLTQFDMPHPNSDITEDSFEGCKALTLGVYNNSSAMQACLEIPQKYRLLDEVEDGFTYTVLNGRAYLTGLVNEDMTGELAIPRKLGGCPVKQIGDYAFAECNGLTCVTVPEGVSSIGFYAFNGCDNLETLKLPKSITYIDTGALNSCPNLVVYVFDNSYALEYVEENGIPYEILTAVSSVDVHPGEIYAPSGISFQPQYCVSPENAPRELTFSSSDESVATVDSDGVITVVGAGDAVITAAYVYDAEVTGELIVHADAASVMKVPAAMKEIGEEAFMGSDAEVIDLTGVPGVKIGPRAFAECPNLKSVILPEDAQVDVTFIEGSAPVVFCTDAEQAAEIEEYYGYWTVTLK